VLDELDAGISGQNMARMVAALENLVSVGGHQLFVSTHSPLVVSNLPADWRIYDLNKSPMRVYERGELGKSQICEMMGFG